ncbi:unnamed protein product [Orchesella dallaii]|uniref:Galectin n=1 Tax=Orchesella dallaii TaxID=48710 RepID=A0ABP1PM53_9HEXA
MACWLAYESQISDVTMLGNGLSVGDKITVTGRILPGAYSFAINIHHKWTQEKEIILFHFNPRISASHVAYDTYIYGHAWITFGSKHSEIYFREGNNFTVEILCQEDQFNVTVDGDSFLEYKYELPLNIADMLEIKRDPNRDVEIFSVGVSKSAQITYSGNTKKDLNSYKFRTVTNWTSNASDTFENTCTCDSTSTYAVAFLIFLCVCLQFSLWLFYGY